MDTIPPHDERKLVRTLYLCGLALSLVAAAAYLVHPSFIRWMNEETKDLIQSFSPPKSASGRVVIVDIDDRTLARHGQWPWSRYRLARLLEEINRQKPAGIVLDLILSEPDRMSPGNWQSAISQDLGHRIDISGVPPEVADHDRYLAHTLSEGPFVLAYEFLFNGGETTPPCQLHPLDAIWINGDGSAPAGSDFYAAGSAVCNRRLFSGAVSRSGFLNAAPDGDGILRRLPLLIRYDDRLYPSLALASLMQAEHAGQIRIVQKAGGILHLVVGGRSIPIDSHGNGAFNFGSLSGPLRRISAGELLEGSAAPPDLNGKIVLVGSSAAGLAKIYSTPGTTIYSDVELQARAVEGLLTGAVVSRPDSFLPWEAFAAIGVAAAVTLSIARMGIAGSGIIAAISIIGCWGGSAILYRRSGVLLSPFLPTVLALMDYLLLTVVMSWKKQQTASEVANDALVLLKSSESTLNSIIKSVPDIIFRLDPTGRITFISPAIARYVASPETFIGHSIFDLVAPADLDKAKYRLNEKRTGDRATRDLEIRLMLPHHHDAGDEEMGYFSVSAEGVYRNDVPLAADFVGTQGIIRDITDQKRLEEKLLHAQKMEVIGNLAAGVAHDLNNILCGLVSYPDLLLLDLPENSPFRGQIERIQKSGQKAAAIVQDLLTLARRGVKISETVNLNRVVSDHLESPEHANLLKYHPNIRMVTTLSPDLLNVKGSRIHLSKVVMNILNNAAEAMPAGGEIRLSTFNRCLDGPEALYEEVPDGEYVCVAVEDEGVGIAAEELKKIFEPFYSRKVMNRSGSGLGMTVIWASVKDHSGYIDIRSTEGDGTRIVLYLPATRESEEMDARRLGIEEYLGTEHILIVDDMPDQLDIAVKMLSKLGYRVSFSTSGEEAVQFLRHTVPDLIVLDMIMRGGMDGLETYRKIKEIDPGLKTVITSGYSESDRVRTVLEIGALGYVQKPYTMEKFGVAVRRALDGRVSP